MEDALDDIRFLANSENRIRVLSALDQGTATRRQLQEETGVPRSSTARALTEAEERGWVVSEGSEYRITPHGEGMVSEIRGTIESTQGIRHLGETIKWLPEPAQALDFQNFRDARITVPTEDNPTAPFDRGLELIRVANVYRGLTQNSLPQYMKEIVDRVERDSIDFEGVIEADFVEVLREDRQRAGVWSPIVDRMWVYDGHVPVNLHVLDETVVIWLCDENHEGDDVIVKGLLETADSVVVQWAESLYAEYRDEATPLDADVLSV
ncbi:helix-turn-helix transcriptional regulator [Halobium palmae]|uniref:Helix-turn-helix transcriptional regulator n=1 Tax=Halobium palmae TaxID=1776492 RepID=A0ABD5S2A5_9EURY